MTWTLIIISILLGVVLLTLEIVVVPGLVTGILGVGLMAFGVWQSYELGGTRIGTLTLLSTLLVCIILLVILIKTRIWKKFSLVEESDSKVNQIDNKTIQIGARGITVARLAPTGKALFDGEMVEVHSINKYIEANTTIEVVAVEGYRIDVCEVSDDRFKQEN